MHKPAVTGHAGSRDYFSQILSDMDGSYQHQAGADKMQHSVDTYSFQETQCPASQPSPNSAAPGPARWAPPMEYAGHQSYRAGLPASFTTGVAYGRPGLTLPFAFDPSIPPPPFGRPPPGWNPEPSTPVHTYGSFPQHEVGPRLPREGFSPRLDSGRYPQQDFREATFGGPRRLEDYERKTENPSQPDVEERMQDAQWIKRFLQSRTKEPKTPPCQQPPEGDRSLREALYGAWQLVSALEESCHSLRDNVEKEGVWTDSYLRVLDMKTEVEEKVRFLCDDERLESVKAKMSPIRKRRRARRQRASSWLQLRLKQREEDFAQKEAAIDRWRINQIHEVEERKKEQELKLAADLVLCEVKKKQADVKRMQDILKSLEKLHKLRKEAAARKGIITEQECDKNFSSRLEQLRSVMKRRTVVYSAEEKALMVMLEGEQEEERKKEQERRMKKERDRALQTKHRMDAMLFGDELPLDPVLQPFREYYTEAQRSLHTIIQVRREWDVFLVPAEHPVGSRVPQSWILPEIPSNEDWASALLTANTN